jgi:hypothetical protein
MIAEVADLMGKHPLATVRIQSGGADSKQASLRAARIEVAILDSGKDRKLPGFGIRSESNFHLITVGGDGRATITVDQPDTEVQASRGQLVKDWLKSRDKGSGRP